MMRAGRELTVFAALQTSTKDLGGSHEAAAAAAGSSAATGAERLPSVASNWSADVRPEPKVRCNVPTDGLQLPLFMVPTFGLLKVSFPSDIATFQQRCRRFS